jgi:Txe/YoeB family toxin of Txe-Axe toxin-antitoxin module
MKKIFVAFQDKKLLKSYNSLKKNKEHENLFKWINRAIDDLKESPSCGIKISKKLWPKEYKKYKINNLWKYNMPNAWRLIYTIRENKVEIISIILEWMDHKEYEKRFRY